MKRLDVDAFRVSPQTKVSLDEWPTLVKPVYESKKEYPKSTAKRRRELRLIRKKLISENGRA